MPTSHSLPMSYWIQLAEKETKGKQKPQYSHPGLRWATSFKAALDKEVKFSKILSALVMTGLGTGEEF